ncbi:DUF4397 domain-containing protein [Pseudoflavitalea sp. G-6-1-2]|uniref:DUF4397 domain-containing protein n=1 Tax=Pseudoflavitalea sp. G-6-1-2 TaxID=2728841 RepID=UPI00146CECED|nr:DUF4397 domain-containing protein [Pseudoflavitalea sp. G-6-1-2]NML20936.1 DUF4397 domain-containing protein [Pseudoflavitalea sp. G-6-1-2]
MRIHRSIKQAPLLLLILLHLVACNKKKLDFEYDNRPTTENRKKSNVRVVNLGGYNQVIANGDSLTNFVVRGPNEDVQRYPGTSYFTKNGRLGKIWDVPMDLFGADEKSKLTTLVRNYGGNFNAEVSFTAENSYSTPIDYYLVNPFWAKDQPKMVAVPRGVTAPSKPDHFKIRIVNLSAVSADPGNNERGRQEDLTGPLTLAFADGTPVSDKTSNVSAATINSEYVELPYGTYQFRVLTADGRPMPGMSAYNQLPDYVTLDPATSTMALAANELTNQVFAPIASYQPGGIYTIVVSLQKYWYYQSAGSSEQYSAYQNMADLISDNNAAANLTYCRLQGANALNAQPINIRANGNQIAETLAFGTAGDYSNLITGTYTLEATDASGKVLATTAQQLRAGMNYTAWLYPAPDGSSKLLVVANDLSGVVYVGGSDDATYNRFKYDYFFYKRFLNLSPDNPYITFTLGNGQPLFAVGGNAQAAVNMQPGIPAIENPNVSNGLQSPPYEFMAYRSLPGVVPGSWADDIPVLKSDNFIARKELYTKPGRTVPVHEPGLYTVALIGSNKGGPKGKMMIIKHNK